MFQSIWQGIKENTEGVLELVVLYWSAVVSVLLFDLWLRYDEQRQVREGRKILNDSDFTYQPTSQIDYSQVQSPKPLMSWDLGGDISMPNDSVNGALFDEKNCAEINSNEEYELEDENGLLEPKEVKWTLDGKEL